MKIALAGNPNSGKTTLYNALTGKQEYVGNWAGVTVSKKEAKLKESLGNNIDIVDLPGAYSIRPYTSEESISRPFVIPQKFRWMSRLICAWMRSSEESAIQDS